MTPFLIGIFVVFLIAVAITIPRLICTCSPNEVLVFSGMRNRKTGKNYRSIKGGWALRVPLFEKVDRVELTNMNIEVEVKNAFAKGGIPLNIAGVANVKVAGESPGLDNALQRLLGKPRPMLMRIAKETLEGYLRGVLASLTPQEVNESTTTFERELRQQAGEGLDRLGLTLDNLKIQSISDDVGYLTAVGRIAGAKLNRDNRIAEASRRSESLVKQAEARREGELSKIQAQLEIAQAESARRVANAETAKEAFVAEQQGEVAALLTRARADLALQDARIEQAKHQLEAEIVTPAKADMEAAIAQARGDAAPIMEQGRAQAQALSELAKQWHEAGDAAKDIFVLQKLEAILPTFLQSIRNVRVDQVTMLQGGDGGGGAGGGGGLPHTALKTVKALEAGGIDVSSLLKRISGDPGISVPSTPALNLQTPVRPSIEAPKRPSARLTAPPPPPAPLSANRGFTPSAPPTGDAHKGRIVRKKSR